MTLDLMRISYEFGRQALSFMTMGYVSDSSASSLTMPATQTTLHDELESKAKVIETFKKNLKQNNSEQEDIDKLFLSKQMELTDQMPMNTLLEKASALCHDIVNARFSIADTVIKRCKAYQEQLQDETDKNGEAITDAHSTYAQHGIETVEQQELTTVNAAGQAHVQGIQMQGTTGAYLAPLQSEALRIQNEQLKTLRQEAQRALDNALDKCMGNIKKLKDKITARAAKEDVAMSLITEKFASWNELATSRMDSAGKKLLSNIASGSKAAVAGQVKTAQQWDASQIPTHSRIISISNSSQKRGIKRPHSVIEEVKDGGSLDS